MGVAVVAGEDMMGPLMFDEMTRLDVSSESISRIKCRLVLDEFPSLCQYFKIVPDAVYSYCAPPLERGSTLRLQAWNILVGQVLFSCREP
jgi:hypothetical protein